MYLRRICTFITVLAFYAVILCSCSGNTAVKSASALSDILRGDYECEISFTLGGDDIVEGTGKITKNGTVTRLDILSPEPYSGMSIEYDTEGLPQSVAVHFSGMSVTLPEGAVARLSPIASLFADDFAASLSSLPKNDMTEYDSDGISGLCAAMKHGDADINLYFSSDGSVPYALEYTKNGVCTDVIFNVFCPKVIEITE